MRRFTGKNAARPVSQWPLEELQDVFMDVRQQLQRGGNREADLRSYRDELENELIERASTEAST